MSKYLKMADVFCGAAQHDADVLFDDEIAVIADFSGYKTLCRYAAHAINHHDALVDENEKLKDHLKQCADELAGMIARYNKQDMETGEWKYDYQTPFDAHKLLNEINQALGEAK